MLVAKLRKVYENAWTIDKHMNMNIEYMNHEINIPRGKATIFVIWAQPDKRPTAGHKACLIAHSGRVATLMIRILTAHVGMFCWFE